MADLLNNTNSNANNYGDDAIVTLSPREHIRLRPGMYVGVVGDGSQPDEALYVLIKEVVDNSIDEFIMGAGRQIDITLADNVVTVRDYGRGIPAGELPYVKNRFYKGSSKNRGSGIGLAVCDEIISRHGGKLDIANAEGGGCIAEISLPLSEN